MKFIDGIEMSKKFVALVRGHSKLIHFAGLKTIGDAFIFLFPILIAKFVAPDVYGAYSLGMMIVFFATTLLLGSSMTPFVISANTEMKEHNSISRSFTNQLIFFFVSLLLIGVLFLIFSGLIADFIHMDKTLLFFLYLAFAGISIKSIIGNYFLGLDKKTEHVKMGIIYGVFMVVFLFVLGFELRNIFLNYFISSVLIFLVSIRKIDFKGIFPLKFDKEMFLEHWTFTKWQMFGLTAVYFINWGDSIIINVFLTLADVGVYNLAYQVFKGIISLLYIVNTFYLPEITRNIKDKEFLSKYLFKTRVQLVSVLGFGTLIGIALSPFLLGFFGEDYNEAGVILQVLLVGVVFKFWSIFYNPLYNVLKRYRYLQMMNIVQIVLNIALGIALVLVWGLIGVAVATTMSYLMRLIVDEIYFHKKVKKGLGIRE
jgi:O-antigen/teichoic acid export membrane protein